MRKQIKEIACVSRIDREHELRRVRLYRIKGERSKGWRQRPDGDGYGGAERDGQAQFVNLIGTPTKPEAINENGYLRKRRYISQIQDAVSKRMQFGKPHQR